MFNCIWTRFSLFINKNILSFMIDNFEFSNDNCLWNSSYSKEKNIIDARYYKIPNILTIVLEDLINGK